MSTNRAEIIALVASYNAVRAPDASEARVIYDAEGRVDGVAAFGRVMDCLTAAERLRVIVAQAGMPAATFLAATVTTGAEAEAALAGLLGNASVAQLEAICAQGIILATPQAAFTLRVALGVLAKRLDCGSFATICAALAAPHA